MTEPAPSFAPGAPVSDCPEWAGYGPAVDIDWRHSPEPLPLALVSAYPDGQTTARPEISPRRRRS